MQLTRRHVLAALMAGTVTRPIMAKPVGLRLAAEWEPHLGCVMALNDAVDTYGNRAMRRIQEEQAVIANAIATFEPVTMLINPAQRNRAQKILKPSITLVEMAHYDIWTRDTLPTIAYGPENTPIAVDWNFNVWGEKFPGYDRDRNLAARFATSRGLKRSAAPIICEGGAIEVDGQGTLITTETCLLNPNRNPGKSRAEIEEGLRQMTGARHIIWLKGSEADTVTDGHIDALMRIIRPGVVVVEVTDDPLDPEYGDLLENLARMRKARDINGQPFEVHVVRRPDWDIMPQRGNDFSSSYVNSYFPNGGIVMPLFNDPKADAQARALFQALEPNRRIVQIDTSEICEGGGGIHCNTMQIPA
ncbi:MAG: agmatine deiminase family protein [Devosiaceae bacterium]|nr:agmatine deiminase family protein [Devosiaceae bacterium]